MSNISLNIGLKALTTAQSALDTVGHNVANANTPGYSRQRLEISADRSLDLGGLRLGNGVRSNTILRTTDSFVIRRLILQHSSQSALDNQLQSMSTMEALLGEPDGFGLGGLMDEYFSSMTALSTDTGDPVLRTAVTQSTTNLTTQFHELARELEQLRTDSSEKISYFVEDVNVRANQLGDLNKEIGRIEASGVEANDLRDQRDEVLRELASQIDITYQEDHSGSVRVLVGGQLLVGATSAYEMSATRLGPGEVELRIAGGTEPVEVSGGAIGGLVGFSRDFVPQVQQQFDDLARNMVLEFNRRHSTGIPQDGGFSHLTGSNRVVDSDGDGEYLDERLGSSGLPFDIQEGELYVNVASETTGQLETTRLAIDPNRMNVGDLVDAISDISNLSASVDSFGRVQVFSDVGFTFDFSSRLNPAPDQAGTFGGDRASVTSSEQEPFAVFAGDTLELGGTLGNFTVAFQAGDFAQPGQATAAELAAAINASADSALNGVRAVTTGDRVSLQSELTGAGGSIEVIGGSTLTALGLTPGTTSGHTTSVNVNMEGDYDQDSNDRWEFRPNMDGEIGTTPGLQVEVFDQNGIQIAALDVGSSYAPGTQLEVGDGIQVSFSYGELSATDGDAFSAEMIGDSDSADVLVALGLNSFFVGSDAETIELRQDLLNDPTLMALSGSGAEGDNATLLEMIELQQEQMTGLDGSVTEFYGNVVGEIAFEVSSTSNALEVEEFLIGELITQRDQVAGVSVDEELVDMVKHEQAYQAAAQFLQVINQLMDELMGLI